LVDLQPDKDTHYIFSDDFPKPIENVNEEEHRIGEKYLSLLGFTLEDNDELVFSLHARELYSLFISICRKKKGK
jgi:hypothetical protein